MATNTAAGTPVPTLGDTPNVPADMLKLATYLDPVTIPRFASTGAANTAFPSPLTGQQANINGVPSIWDGANWVAVNPGVSTYVPAWTGAGGNPASPAVKNGFYKIQGGFCFLSIFCSFNAGTTGGNGALSFSLPVTAASGGSEQILQAKLYTVLGISGNWNGLALIDSGGTTCKPMFALSGTSSVHDTWKGDVSGPGSGVPALPAQYSVHNGGNICISGTYRI